ncbi:MAG: hypothetical protein ACLPWD_03555 [Methanobacterium sp.]
MKRMGLLLGVLVIAAVVAISGCTSTNTTSNSSQLKVGNVSVSGPDEIGDYSVNTTITPSQDYSYLEMDLTWYDSSGTVIDSGLGWNVNNVKSGQTYQANGQSDLYQKGTPTKVDINIYDSPGASSSDLIYNATVNINS